METNRHLTRVPAGDGRAAGHVRTGWRTLALAMALMLLARPQAYAEPRILNGTPVPSAHASGMVQIFTSAGLFCSGSLLANDWVVTAAHCGITTGTVTNNVVHMGNLGDPLTQVRRGDFAVAHPSLDFALLHLEQTFTLGPPKTGYKLGLYPDTSFSLIGQPQAFYGYSDDGISGPYVLRTANVLGAGPFGAHNHGGVNLVGQASVPGDSGGPLIREALGVRALTGILKCGFTECLARPETFRGWILAQLYDRPIPFPDVWFLPFSPHPNLGAVPLQNSYVNERAILSPRGRWL